jgi:hypothetical protein
MKSAATVIRFPEPGGSGLKRRFGKCLLAFSIRSQGCIGQTEKGLSTRLSLSRKGEWAKSYPHFMSRREGVSQRDRDFLYPFGKGVEISSIPFGKG